MKRTPPHRNPTPRRPSLPIHSAFAFLGALAFACAALGQGATKLDKPLSETDLINTIDTIGAGDPLKKAPLSVGEGAKKAEPKEEKKKDLKGTTEILSKTANFDQKAHQAVFVGDVVVTNPEFKIMCDKLTAFLKNDDKPKTATKPTATPPKAPGTPAPATNGEAPKKAKGGGGLDRAIAEAAEGKKVIITQEKMDESGKPVFYQGKAEKADYNTLTGEVVLTGWPEVQQGLNTSVATERGTVMFLNRDGRLRTEGQSKIVIKDSGPDQADGR